MIDGVQACTGTRVLLILIPQETSDLIKKIMDRYERGNIFNEYFVIFRPLSNSLEPTDNQAHHISAENTMLYLYGLSAWGVRNKKIILLLVKKYQNYMQI